MKATLFSELIKGNAYPGRGIIIGKTADGTKSAVAYFLTGRSENSRNRVLCFENGSLFTRPFDQSKVKDPSLIIYRAMATLPDKTIITNGDQTDTVAAFLAEGKTFEDALYTRTFEPDEPNFTPRISGIINFNESGFDFELSILKRNASGDCERLFYNYKPVSGEGKFLSTYDGDGSPLPSFSGEPKTVLIKNDLSEFASDIFTGLENDNKISVFAQFTDLKTGRKTQKTINKNQG